MRPFLITFAAGMMELILEEERLILLPERLVWWPAQKTFILSDLHWGKSAHFRKHGIPMPGATQDDDAMKLAAAVRQFGAERLIIAGDFFHSKQNNEVDEFGRWRVAHAQLHIDFVLGNHDILPRQAYHSWQLAVHESTMIAGPFLISHDFIDDSPRFIIHGHLHPGIRLRGMGRQSAALPAFCIDRQRMILPAFGRFTGCKMVYDGDFTSVYVVGDGKVLQWK